MKTQRGLRVDGSRYDYDFGSRTTKEGWAQVDTKQDASYYGTWANPFKRMIFCYCEGDTTLQTAETEAEFVEAVQEWERWNEESGYWLGIDPGFNPELKTKFQAIGLGALLHEPTSRREKNT